MTKSAVAIVKDVRQLGHVLQDTLTMVARDPETKLNNRTVLASTKKRPVEIERLLCPHGHGSKMMQATPQQSLYWNARRAVQPQDSAWTGAMFEM